MKSFAPIPVLVAAGLALAASGCATPHTPDALAAKTPSEQFPFKVNNEADETLLAVHPPGVSANQTAAVTQAVSRWRDAGGEVIMVRIPAGGPMEPIATAMADQVRSVLISRGVAYNMIQLERYNGAADPASPLVVGFSRFRAEVPTCGLKWDNLSATKNNEVHSNFGCAISANMAAQVANPRDLVQARAADPSDAARATFQMDQYRQGQDTASTAKNDGGKVSAAVQ